MVVLGIKDSPYTMVGKCITTKLNPQLSPFVFFF